MTAVDAVNLDTSSAIAFVMEGSTIRAQLKAYVQGRSMLLCMTAEREFRTAVGRYGGPLEQARAGRLLARVTIVPDGPSPRAAALRPTNHLGLEDIIIFGTGDALGVVTTTGDAQALRAAAGQGVTFAAYLHPPARLKGL
jgi:hypothetical protein